MELFISEVIKHYGLSQQSVADKSGVSLQNLKNIIYKNKPTISTLEKFANAIGCEIGEFFYNPLSKENPFYSERKEKVVSVFTINETGKKYKIVEIDE